jgi:hypothetical protein
MFDAMKAMEILYSQMIALIVKNSRCRGGIYNKSNNLGMFADAVVLGQGEDALLKITNVIERDDIPKAEKLEIISKIQGVMSLQLKKKLLILPRLIIGMINIF